MKRTITVDLDESHDHYLVINIHDPDRSDDPIMIVVDVEPYALSTVRIYKDQDCGEQADIELVL